MPEEDKKEQDAVKEAPSKEGETPKEDGDFVHLVRLAGVVVSGDLTLIKALMKIKGIGPRVAETLIKDIGMPAGTKVGNLKENEISLMEEKIEGIHKLLPSWMLNHRKEITTGKDIHFVGPELDMATRENINFEKKIRTYRGVRHQLNLPVRGQRTRSSFRKGSTVGVSHKKAAKPAKAEKK